MMIPVISDVSARGIMTYQPIIFMVGLGLFMTLLRLDVGEALVTMFGLNILSALFQIAMFMLIIAILASEAKKGGGFDDDLNYQDSQGQFQGDDEDFAPNNGGFGDPFGPDDE